MLQASFLRSYKTTNKHGQKTDMFVYRVTGTATELSEFELAQGEYHRTDPDGTPVWITPKGYGPQVSLIIAPATEEKPARVFADTSAIAMAMSLMQQYKGTAIEQAIAQQIAGSATNLGAVAAPTHNPPTED